MSVKETFTPANPDYRARVERKIEGNAFMHHLGFTIHRIEPGLIEGELDLQAIHKQQFGRLHGGVVTAITDIVAGFAVYTLAPANKDVVTGEIKISYLRPGFGQKVKAIGTVLKPGKNISFAEADVFTEDEGRIIHIARATTTMVLIDAVQQK